MTEKYRIEENTMRLMTIASGSSGNCTYIGSDNTHILIDSGISRKRILEGLKKADLSINDISAIFITHEHWDHISGLRVLTKNLDVPVYASKGTIDGIISSKSGNEINKDILNVIPYGITGIGDISIDMFSVSHDANEPSAYSFTCNGKKAAVVTDLGFYNDSIKEKIKDVNALVLEANHDVNMLMVGPYPYYLKQRVMGNRGHLSNETCGRLLSQIIHDDMKNVLLGHLSKENNYTELAYQTVANEIDLAENEYKASDFNIGIASREQASAIIEF